MPRAVRRFLLAFTVGSLVLAAYAAFLIQTVTDVDPRYALTPDFAAPIALVLSGDPGSVRTLRAVELFDQRRVSKVLISGFGFGGDSAKVLGDVAVAAGLPPEALMLETRAISTWENFVNSRKLLEAAGLERVVIVTSRVHARRAIATAQRALCGIAFRVERVDANDEDLFNRSVEVLKAVRYAALGRMSWRVALGLRDAEATAD